MPARWTASLALVLLTGFVAAVEYSVLMPTAWQYVQQLNGTEMELGVALSLFPAAKLAAFLPVGVAADAGVPMRAIFVLCLALQVGGNMSYGLAGHCGALWMVYLGRAGAGLGAALATLVSAYIARAQPIEAQTHLFAVQTGARLVGNVLGPAVNVGLARLHVEWGIIDLNPLTAPGYLLALLNALLIVAFAGIFREPPPAVRRRGGGGEGVALLPAQPRGALAAVAEVAGGLGSTGAWWCLHVIFCLGGLLSMLETAITPITKAQYGWGTVQNSLLFGGIAGAALLAVAAVIVLDRRGKVRTLNIALIGVGLLLAALVFGAVACTPHEIPLWSLLTFAGGMIVGLIMMGTSASGLCACPPAHSTRQRGGSCRTDSVALAGRGDTGKFMAVQLIAASLARVLGPIAAGAAFQMPHPHRVFFCGALGLAATLPITAALCRRRLDAAVLAAGIGAEHSLNAGGRRSESASSDSALLEGIAGTGGAA